MAEDKLLTTIKGCVLCKKHLPFDPRPILSLSAKAKVMITGQAPGIKAHDSKTPWNDASGNRLREWLGISKDEFYDPPKNCHRAHGLLLSGQVKVRRFATSSRMFRKMDEADSGSFEGCGISYSNRRIRHSIFFGRG